jgi:HAD superfamily hydrolase (TIGR01509 family)
MIETIFFDLVGVLLIPRENYAANRLVDEIDRLVGTVTNDAVFKEQTLIQFNLHENEFKDILQSIVNKYEPFAPLWNLLPKIRKTYKLGIINNGTFLTFPLFDERYQISQRFDLFVSSALECMCKPDRAIYLRACEKLGSQPHNCLFMDDSEENILGAQRDGMQTIHWSDKINGFQEFKDYVHTFDNVETD